LTEGEIGVLSVFSLFLDVRGSVCVCMCADTHTHIRTAHGVLGCEPRVERKHLESPKNSNGLNFGICVFVQVYKAHICVYICWEAE